MYSSGFDTRSLRPRATLNPNATHLPRIYHYEAFAGGNHNVATETPRRLSNVPSTPAPIIPTPRRPAPSATKKMKTAGKAIHRLTTYWDVVTHYNLMEFMKKKNIVIVGESKLLSFLSFLFLTFAFCCLYMLIVSPDHNLALQSYISNMFNNPNSTLDRLKDEAARQYEQINKDDPPSSSSPSSYPPPSHHHHPSAQSIYEEKLEKLVREDLARLESHMKRLDDQARKLNELTQSVDQKTKSLEDQQKKLESESNSAIASSGRTEKSLEESKKEILSQINKLQTDFANIKPTHTEPSGTKDDEKVREREKMREKEFSDLVSRVEKLQKEVNDDTQKDVVSELQSQIKQLQSDLAKSKPSNDNQEELEELRAQVQKLQKELADVKNAPVPTPAPSNSRPEIITLTEELAQRVQTLLKADITGRVDYALYDLGARIVYERTSPSYTRASSSIFGEWWPVSQHFRDPRVILNQDVSPGQCWPMSGSTGHVAVKLAQPIAIGAVSIDHISPLISPDISSAPKSFTVKGLVNETDIGTVLGTFRYDTNTPHTVQTFEITNNQEVFPIVMLSVLDNHGHSNYTCIYRFRVHPRKP